MKDSFPKEGTVLQSGFLRPIPTCAVPLRTLPDLRAPLYMLAC